MGERPVGGNRLLAVGLVACGLAAAAGAQAQVGPITHAGSPAWSPDGRRIAFAWDRTGTTQIWVMNADGRARRQVTSLPSGSSFPLWSADGRLIAFARASNRSQGVWLYVVRPDGSEQRRVTRFALFGWGFDLPAWSPRGAKLAYTKASAPSLGGHAGVYVVDADGRERRLTPPSVLDYHGSSWSPDGRRIAFAAGDGRGGWVGVMNADGSGRRKLTKHLSAPVDSLQWSPDGRRLVFVSGGIHVIDANGRHARLLTRQLPSFSSRPTWSPDSRRIVFARRGPPYVVGGDQIVSIDAGGGGLRVLVRSPFGVDAPVWSPDGRTIAYTARGSDEGSLVYVINADGSGKRRLTR